MVTVEEVVQPWELHWLELIDFNALFTDCLQMPFLHRTVVACIAETVEDGPHLNAFLCLCSQMAYQFLVDGVVAEVEIFQVNARACLVNCLEQVVELLLSGRQQGDRIVMRKTHPFFTELIDEQGVSSCFRRCMSPRNNRSYIALR